MLYQKVKPKLNPKYKLVGKIEMTMPNMLVSASDKTKRYGRCKQIKYSY